MRLHIIACQVFRRELCFYASQSAHIITLSFLPQGLHDTPARLNQMLAEEIDRLYRLRDSGALHDFPDAIALGYGLCSNGVLGLEARDVPLVVPRTDDCIAVFLGSQARYKELFDQFPGTYWVNSGWLENAFVPSEERLADKRQEYIEQYGEENAEYLFEQLQGWPKNYTTCGFITTPVYPAPAYREQAQEIARYNGWQCREFEGDDRLLGALVTGEWNEKDFLVCPPGHRIVATTDERKIDAVPMQA
ncbi:MAG: DUF1638 domain-containing protein [Oscillospiraceae bacterium]|nr:DUF1638 domain-containing protein [Oscillospiraceae bacterium]